MPLARLARAAGEQHQGLPLPRDRLPGWAVAESPVDNGDCESAKTTATLDLQAVIVQKEK